MTSTRRALATAALALTAAVGAGAPAHAAVAPAGYSTVLSCTGVTGSTTYAPGLRLNIPRTTAATVSAALTGCSDAYGSDQSGQGSLAVSLSGTSSYGHVLETGTFVVGWPAVYSPSVGSMTLSGPAADGTYSAQGTVTSGAFVGAVVSTRLFPTGTNAGATGRKGHPLTQQSFVAAAPLTLSRNLG